MNHRLNNKGEARVSKLQQLADATHNRTLPLGERSFLDLYEMRNAPGADQGMLAPFEHRAFAREWTEENPVRAGLTLPFAIPAYTLAKLLGLTSARSPASLDEVFAGYHGLTEGMLNRLVPGAAAQSRRPTVKPGAISTRRLSDVAAEVDDKKSLSDSDPAPKPNYGGIEHGETLRRTRNLAPEGDEHYDDRMMRDIDEYMRRRPGMLEM